MDTDEGVGGSNLPPTTEPTPRRPRVHLIVRPPPNESEDGSQRRPAQLPKVRVVAVPDDTVRQENAKLRADLAAAQHVAQQHAAQVHDLQAQLLKQNDAIADMQRHEGEMEAQFFGDQQSLEKMNRDFAALYPQALEAQRQLMQQNEEVDRLQRLITQRTDEVLQLRHRAQMQKSPIQAPCRGKRASLVPVHNTGRRTIELPLDPAPMPHPSSSETSGSTTPPPPAADIEKLAELVATFLTTTDSKVTVTKDLPNKKSSGQKIEPHDKDVVNYINNKLRKTTFERFNVTQASDFALHVPASVESVEACEDGITNDPPAHHFQWDFSDGYSKSRWNDVMIQKVVNIVLREDGSDGPIADNAVHRDFLEMKLGEQLARYRASWKQYQPRFLKDQNRMETVIEAQMRALGTNHQHLSHTRSTTMKRTKLATRVDTIVKTIEIKKLEGTAGDLATWERLLEMVSLLGEQGMSSEEEDEIVAEGVKIRIFKVKVCIWREPKIVDYLRFVDTQTAQFKSGQRARGPKPAPRVRGPAVGNGAAKAPIGLPQSLYNGEWLAAASPGYVKELKVSKRVFELFVAATGRMGT